MHYAYYMQYPEHNVCNNYVKQLQVQIQGGGGHTPAPSPFLHIPVSTNMHSLDRIDVDRFFEVII